MTPPTTRRRLYRSRDDRVVAGVCAGVADHFGIDPVLVRVALVALTILGGSGLLAYIVAWIVIPEEPEAWEDEPPPVAARPDTVVGAVLIGLGILVVGPLVLGIGFGGWHGPGDGDLFPAVALLGIGAWLLLRDRGDDEARYDDDDRRSAFTSSEPLGYAHARSASVSHADPGGAGAAPRAGNDLDETLLDEDTAVTADLPPVPPWTSYFPDPTPRESAAPEYPLERRRSLPGQLVSGALLLGGGVLWLLAANGAVELSVGDVLALALLAFGLGLVVSAFVGRGAGILVPAIGTALALGLVSAIDFPLRGGIGDRRFAPDDTAELLDGSPYSLLAGEMVLDLSDTELATRAHEVLVTHAFGDLTVKIPDGVEVDLEIALQGGDVRIDDELGDLPDQDGWDVHVTGTVGDESAERRIDLEIDMGFGEVVIERA